MEHRKGNHRLDKETILADVLKILEEMTAEWETGFAGSMGPETRLVGDLYLESIDVVQLVVSIEEHFQRQDLPFQKLLMSDGRYVDDIRMGELVDFLHAHLNNVVPAPTSNDTK